MHFFCYFMAGRVQVVGSTGGVSCLQEGSLLRAKFLGSVLFMLCSNCNKLARLPRESRAWAGHTYWHSPHV